ncbi:MAG TPA: hypothetical protein VIF14_17825 [Alphaproteobacteria bacterium]|jgi:hypothetical protein
MLRRLLPLLALALAAATPARAQTALALFQEMELVGTFAYDCARAAGDNGNVRTIYAGAANGALTLTYEFGPARAPNRYTILTAHQVAPGRVFYLEELSDGRRIEIVLLKQGNRIRVWSSRMVTGQVLVANGRFASDGRDSPWQTRCY